MKEKLEYICANDVAVLLEKDREYGGSWKKRGGVGAFMMLARKWDRLEEQVSRVGYNIFEAAKRDQREEGILDDLRDLRRYLLLVESELLDPVRPTEWFTAKKLANHPQFADVGTDYLCVCGARFSSEDFADMETAHAACRNLLP
jgi:hypothetical protein